MGCGERRVNALCEPDALETIPITITITITLTLTINEKRKTKKRSRDPRAVWAKNFCCCCFACFTTSRRVNKSRHSRTENFTKNARYDQRHRRHRKASCNVYLQASFAPRLPASVLRPKSTRKVTNVPALSELLRCRPIGSVFVGCRTASKCCST